MSPLNSGRASRSDTFAHAEEIPFNHVPDPADLFLHVTQPIDISEYLQAAAPSAGPTQA